jgi:hypothetical protein
MALKNGGAIANGNEIKIYLPLILDNSLASLEMVSTIVTLQHITNASTSNLLFIEFEEKNVNSYLYFDLSSNTITNQKSYFYGVEDSLSTTVRNGFAADAKAVGDALALKIDKTEIATDDEIIEMLMAEDMFPVVTDTDGSLLADENGNILLW